MTHSDWIALFAPILSAIVLGVAGMLTALLAVGTTRLRAWLNAKGRAAESQAVADASVRLQAAMGNAAGNLALGIQTGTIDPTSLPDMQRAAAGQAAKIAAKLPDALALLKPLEGAVAEAVLGKLGNLIAPIVSQFPPSPPRSAP